MSIFDVKCEANQQPDGSWTLEMTITGLTVEQANEISHALRMPVREAVVAAVNKKGKPVTVMDLLRETPH